ncbi:MAG: TRAP transporter small permease subunit, partial [Pseudomonadota bacterium]
MSDSSGQEIVSINDPGEVGREDHNIGDRFVVTISNLVAWAWPALMIAIVSQVILRGAGHNQAWLDDLQWWIYGIAVLIAFGYAVTTNAHVRVDIFFAGFPKERKTRIEIFGLVWLLLPFIILSWDVTFHYAVSSVLAWEGSDSPNGLHNLWILKCLMNLSFAFIGIAIWAAYVRFLEQLTDPDLWKQLLIAFPSTMFLVNLTIYYLMYWFFYVTGGPDMNPRRITR